MSPQPAAFLDRDGVLNEDTGYVFRRADFAWRPGVFEALRALQAAGYALVVVTNQSGIGRGLYTEADFEQLTDWMRAELARERITLAGVYHCPHHPEAPLAAYRRACDCRKPQPGMLLRAASELNLDLAASCLFGDKPGDIEAGRAAGVGRCLRIDTHGRARVQDGEAVFADLAAAVRALQLSTAAHAPLDPSRA